MVAPILERNDIAIRRAAKNFQHLAREHPIVPMQNARPWFNDKPGHEEVMKQENRKAGFFLGFSCVPAFLIVYDVVARPRAARHFQTPQRQSPRSLRSRRRASLRRHRSSLGLRRYSARSDSAERRGPESDFRIL